MDGAEFLEVLQANIDERGQALARGELALTLNPRCVAFLAAIFGEYEATGRFSHELSSHSDLVALYSFFLRLPALVLQPTSPGADEPVLDLGVFVGLTSLQAHDLVTPAFTIPATLRERLQLLSVRGMLHAAGPLMREETGWPKLRRLDLSHNFIKELGSDEGVNGLNLATLNLSHNLLSKMPPLDRCLQLQRLNLSFNRIPDVSNIKECVGGIKSLALQGNSLVSSAGVQFLMALESLDMRDNSITAWEDVKLLRRLPFLADLWLIGNPLCNIATYRLDVFRLICVQNDLRETASLLLDGSAPSKAESQDLAALQRQMPVSFSSPPQPTRLSVQMNQPSPLLATRASAAAATASTSPVGAMSASSYVGPTSLSGGFAARERSKKKKSAMVVLEAEPFKPKALEQLEPPTMVPVVAETAAVAQEAAEFAEKVKKLHDEGGSKWLVILDGLEKEEGSSSVVTGKSPRKSGSSHRRKSSGNLAGGAIKKASPRPSETEIVAEATKAAEVVPVRESMVIVTMDTEQVEMTFEAAPVVAFGAAAAVASASSSAASTAAAVAPPASSGTTSPREGAAPVNPKRSFGNTMSFGGLGALKKRSSPRFTTAAAKRNSQMVQPQQVESEFLVLRQNKASGEYDLQRVLMIGSSRITEADVEHGETVVTLDTTDLCAVDTIDFNDGVDMGPVVKLEFRSRGGEQESKTAYAWRTLDAIDGAKFLARCRALLAKNLKAAGNSNRSKCISCNHVFDGSLAVCPQCQSEFVVSVAATPEPPSPQPPSAPDATSVAAVTVAAAAPDAAPAAFAPHSLTRSSGALGGVAGTSSSNLVPPSTSSSVASEFMARKDLEHGLEVFLKLKILIDAAAEQFVFLLKTDVAVLTERSPLEIEKPMWVMMTTERLYILNLNEAASGFGFTVASSYLLSSFVRLTVGLFMSWIRFDGPSSYVLCCTSSHLKTHRTLDLARETMPKALLMHVGAVSASVIKRSVLGGGDVVLYVRVRVKRKTRRATMLFSAGSEWRSLIMSSDLLVLCEEDAGRWFVHSGGAPNFTDQQQRSLVDVTSLVNDGDNSVVIEFDSDAKHVLSWQLEFASPQDKVRSTHILSETWSAQMGGIALPQS